MDGKDDLYSIHFEGSAEDFGFSDESDYLTAVDAHEIAVDVAQETDSEIIWEGINKPSWA